MATIFKQPAEYAIYGGPADGSGPVVRITGVTSVAEAEDAIFHHKKGHPGWDYQVWQAGGWTKVQT